MARIFITGSADGLGRAAAQSLLDQGHEVLLHARNAARAESLSDISARSLGVVTGDLQAAGDVRSIAEQVNDLGRMNAIIHNAGVYDERSRGSTPEGHARLVAVNTLAPYLLTALIDPPDRQIYLSSSLHHGGSGPLQDVDWTSRPWDASRAYGESKLHVIALAFALARRWPQVLSHAVDPGWARTKMGGASAPVDLETGQRTQSWLAVSREPAVMVSGQYWHNMQTRTPAPEATNQSYQDSLLDELRRMTGVGLP